ncbi:MAG: TetR/AcrR family transcriptional regulator, partial [Acidobacteria bacterium]|nr:TetR/AcrR family transcriptional regulator [Acidobacteriota bacterium]
MKQAGETKHRILDAAERLFAERGFDAASLRAITAAAGVNLAAVNYHFRSKDELIRAVLARNMAPLNARRLELLDAFEARAQGRPVPVEHVVRALISPMLELKQSPGHANLPTLVGRMYADPSPRTRQLFVDELGEISQRFRSALQRSLPHVPTADLYWRIGFMIGSTVITVAASWIIRM